MRTCRHRVRVDTPSSDGRSASHAAVESAHEILFELALGWPRRDALVHSSGGMRELGSASRVQSSPTREPPDWMANTRWGSRRGQFSSCSPRGPLG